MYELPTSIKIDGREYQIRNNGDYRVILDCFQALGDVELDAKERLLAALIIFYQDFSSIEDIDTEHIEQLVSSMYEFFNCGSSSVGTKSNHKLVDWKQDSQLICSAINKVANTEIRAVPYAHWWTFMGYYIAIGESPISTIIHIRDKISKGQPLEKNERQYKQSNPQYFNWDNRTLEDVEADKLVREIWNNGG